MSNEPSISRSPLFGDEDHLLDVQDASGDVLGGGDRGFVEIGSDSPKILFKDLVELVEDGVRVLSPPGTGLNGPFLVVCTNF